MQRTVDVGPVRLEPFHFELVTVFLQPPPLVRVFFWFRLLLLLVGGTSRSSIKAVTENKSVSDD